MNPDVVLRNAARLLDQEADVLLACWVVVTENREAFAAGIRDGAATLPVVPCIVRNEGFDDPNTVLQDLLRVVETHKTLFEGDPLREMIRKRGKVSVVLLSRRELGVPMAASPITLPEWFPIAAGELHTARIHDLTWHANVPMSTPEAKTGELAGLLFELEGALIGRLKNVRGQNKNLINGLFDRIKNDKESKESFEDMIARAEEARTRVTAAAGFRPSVRERASLTARLWFLASATSPDQLSAAGAALAIAAGLANGPRGHVREFLLSVLSRPSSPDTTLAPKWGRSVLTAIRASCQFITAAAHADAYPESPITLIRATSLDLRCALEAYCNDLNEGMSPLADPRENPSTQV